MLEEVCDGDQFEGRCDSGSVLEILAARYGRVKLGQCINRDLGFLGCGKDALPEMDAWCSGRERCSVIVDKSDNPDLNEGNDCFVDIVSHLEVEYQCVSGGFYMSCRVKETPKDKRRKRALWRQRRNSVPVSSITHAHY